MKTGPDAFTTNMTEGVRKVLKGNFAFLITRDWGQKFVNMYPEDFVMTDTNMMQVSAEVQLLSETIKSGVNLHHARNLPPMRIYES